MRHYVTKTKRLLSESLAQAASRPPLETLIHSRSIDHAELRTMAGSRGAYWEYSSGGTVDFNEPFHLGSHPADIARKIGRFDIEQPFVVELSDVDLVGPHPIAITNSGKFLLEQSLRSPPLLLRGVAATIAAGLKPYPSRQVPSSVEHETIVPLVGVWNRGFFHWFSEWLPRLEGLERYHAATGRSPTLLIPSDPPAWMTDSLRLLGFDSQDWIEWTGGRTQIPRLVIPSLRRAHGTMDETTGYVVPPNAYRWVRNRLHEAVFPNDSDTCQRILITRHGADERRLTNVGAITREIENLEPQTLSNLELEDQIRIFANAELVIGPHGAGFTNLIHSSNPIVIEAFGDFVNACYFTLCSGLGHAYAYAMANAEGADISIEPEAITTLLNLVRSERCS